MDNLRSIIYFKKLEEQKSEGERDETLVKLLDADLNYKLRRVSNTNNHNNHMAKEIKIFIASQSVLNTERDFIENLIRGKNDDFVKKGIYLKPIRWEYLDKGMGIERKQDEFNKLLLDSEYVIYLTWDSIGHYTKEEFELGYNSMKNGIKPYRIYVFNKTVARRITNPNELIGTKEYLELKEQLWKEERIVIEFSSEITIQNELDNLFTEIEKKYL